MRTFGTLGHVDHGKSSLVRALTGIDPDRLAEEKAREMTIDLGFAWLKLPSGKTMGIVDVPGHRDFIENMLAGVSSVDAVILVVAADEGIMPQTREHISILRLLGIEHGLVVLTKIDIMNDEEWLALIEDDIRRALSGTMLADCPILRISARAGANLHALRAALDACIDQMPEQRNTTVPRLAIDRVFTMHGFGTVITGTLRDGILHTGEIVEINPGALQSRIRSLQIHGTNVPIAYPGSRTAVNLVGIDRDEIARGDVLSVPGALLPTQRMDLYVTVLENASGPLQHNTYFKAFIHTADVEARIRVLGADEIPPGQQGWIQVETQEPIVASKGDRCLLRQISPGMTIAGGVVVDPHPLQRHKRFSGDMIATLEARLASTPAQQIAQAADALQPANVEALRSLTGLNPELFASAFASALDDGLLVELSPGHFMNTGRADSLIAQVRAELTVHHSAYPLQPGMSQEVLKRRLGIKPVVFQALVARTPDIRLESGIAALSVHRIAFNDTQQKSIRVLQEAFDQRPYTPPTVVEASAIVGEDVLEAMIALGKIIRLTPDVIFAASTYHRLVSEILETIAHEGSITVAAVRDRYGTSRKYALALLEHMDTQGITKRVGDIRLAGHKS